MTLLAGRTPRTKADGLTIQELCNHFLTAKKSLVDNREITARTFTELYSTCERVGGAFGWNRLVVDLAADDFDRLRRAIAKQWGPIRLGNEIQRVRSLFKYGFEAGLIHNAGPIRPRRSRSPRGRCCD